MSTLNLAVFAISLTLVSCAPSETRPGSNQGEVYNMPMETRPTSATVSPNRSPASPIETRPEALTILSATNASETPQAQPHRLEETRGVPDSWSAPQMPVETRPGATPYQ